MLYQGMEAEENKKYGERYGIVNFNLNNLVLFLLFAIR